MTTSNTPAAPAVPTITSAQALADAADLVQARGFSPRYLEHPKTGALAIDRAIQVALGYTWEVPKDTDEDTDPDEVQLVFTSPSKAATKAYEQAMKALRNHLESIVSYRLPSVGWWNMFCTAHEEAVLVLRIAAAQQAADQARIARYKAIAAAKKAQA